MMIKRRLAAVALFFSLLFVFLSVTATATEKDNRYFSALFVGVDDSALNTDVIAIMVYDKQRNSIDVLQVPRDTLYRDGTSIFKVNFLFPKKLVEINDKKRAFHYFSETVSDIFDIEFDASIAISTDSFSDLIDAIGGIDVVLPQNIYNKLKNDLDFAKLGKNHFDGRQALQFVRYRKAYGGGDLSRLDAQKIFFEGLFTSLKKRGAVSNIHSILSGNNGIIYDYSLHSIVSLLTYAPKISSSQLSAITLPGSAVVLSNISYFLPDRDRCTTLLKNIFPNKTINFDSKRVFSLNNF